jgi:hypothetical protein
VPFPPFLSPSPFADPVLTTRSLSHDLVVSTAIHASDLNLLESLSGIEYF